MDERERLIKFQESIQAKEFEKAKELGLAEDGREPIYDGIPDIDAYVKSPLKIMWILKEPWEEGNNGEPGEGKGGWTIWDYWKPETKIPTCKVMMYVMYGIATGIPYSEMPWPNEDMLKLLKSSAYINVNKMPSKSKTNPKQLQRKFQDWRDIILEQIAGYKPDVIIFGYTFEGIFMNEDFAKNPIKEQDLSTPGIVGAYVSSGKLLVDAYHPAQRTIKRRVYVDTIVKAVRGFRK